MTIIPYPKNFFKAYFSGLLLFPLVLMILPADFFDSGPSLCLSVLLLNTPCYGCGITRAIQHLIHLDFKTAYAFNHLSLIIFPLLVGIWLGEVRRMYKKIKNAPKP